MLLRERESTFPALTSTYGYATSMASKPRDTRARVSRSERGLVAWLKLPLVFDADALLDDARRISPQWWIAHFNPQDYRGNWTIAPLRGPAGETHPIRLASSDPAATDWVDTPALDSCVAIRHVLDRLECPIKSTRLMRLAASAEILEHTDHELGYEDGEVRLHVPIETSPAVEFWLNGQRVEMQPGELWYLNVNLPHRVANRSSRDRTHLVIDCEVNPWMEDLFQNTLNASTR